MTAADVERLMDVALEAALAADGVASPNPTVGAVVATAGGQILATGVTAPVGGPHAEVVALGAAGTQARGATLLVTLEPCAHHGRTPPCVDAVVAAGVRRVVVAARDPDPRVAGHGVERLREAGLVVDTGVRRAAAERLHLAFAHWATTGRPYLTAKLAQSLDGRVATATGESRWITGTAAREHAHRARARADAVLVGVGTVLADDPLLSARPAGVTAARQPLRVVADSRLRTPPGARLLGGGGVLVACADPPQPARAGALRAAGAEVVAVGRGGDGRLDLAALLRLLGARGVSTLIAEGGPTLHGGLADAGLVDAVTAYIAPRIVGGRAAPAAVAGEGVGQLDAAARLVDLAVARAGDDLVVTCRYPRDPWAAAA